MKILRHPWVVLGLSVVALGLVFYQVFQGRLRATASARFPTAAPTVAERKALPLAESPTGKGNEPGEAMLDQNYAQTHIAEWLESPRRDPFLLAGPASDKAAGTNVSAIAGWRLKAIWRQTGGRVAAINDRIYQEGDTIKEYKIERIEGDEVWLAGPRGKERLGFEKSQAGSRASSAGANPSNQPAASPSRNPPDARP